MCGSGDEAIENGGFEDYFENWDAGIDAYTTTIYKRSGSRSLGLIGYSYPNLAWVKQTLATAIPVECVDEFKLYCHADWYPALEKQLLVTIGYTDKSTTEVTLSFYDTYTWHEKDLLSDLSAGKTIEYIQIETLSDGDINVDDVSICYEEPPPCTDVLIENSGGSLCCKVIDWREGQACKVAVRSVSLRTSGSFVDTETYTLKNRKLDMTIRLTDAQKTTLQAIFDQSALVTITAVQGTVGTWTYTAWLRKKPIIYEYSKDSEIREWLAELEFVVKHFIYEPTP